MSTATNPGTPACDSTPIGETGVAELAHSSAPFGSILSEPMSHRPKSLKELAQPAGFNADSLSVVSGLNVSTIRRYWLRTDWLAKIGGPNLKCLAAAVPGVERELVQASLDERGTAVVNRLDRLGIALNDDALEEALDDRDIEPQYLYTALAAAAAMLTDDTTGAVSCLYALWGRGQNPALEVIFGTHPAYPVVREPQDLAAAAERALDEIVEEPAYSYVRAIASTQLAHQLGKTSGELLAARGETSSRGHRVQQSDSFLRRSSYMGVLRKSEDLDLAEKYDRLIKRDPIAKGIEAWVFPSWCGDAEAGENFTLNRSVFLRRTAIEVLREIDSYNDTYVLYLVVTYLPIALEEDPEFGGRLDQLQGVLTKRAEHTELVELREAAARLARRIANRQGSDV